MNRYYLNCEIIDNPAQLMDIRQGTEALSQRSGITHYVDTVDVPDGILAVVYVDKALVDSGEYRRRMAEAVNQALAPLFDMLEEAIVESTMDSTAGTAAADQVADFFKTR